MAEMQAARPGKRGAEADEREDHGTILGRINNSRRDDTPEEGLPEDATPRAGGEPETEDHATVVGKINERKEEE